MRSAVDTLAGAYEVVFNVANHISTLAGAISTVIIIGEAFHWWDLL